MAKKKAKAKKKATPKAKKRKGYSARGATAQMKKLAGISGNE